MWPRELARPDAPLEEQQPAPTGDYRPVMEKRVLLRSSIGHICTNVTLKSCLSSELVCLDIPNFIYSSCQTLNSTLFIADTVSSNQD